MEEIRSFIAIELPDEVRRGLSRVQARLKSGGQLEVKWVDPNSIHLTLKFLGNIAVGRIGEITTAIEESAKGISPFRLEVKDLGVFPNPRRVQVAWVGVSGELDKLAQLQQRIEENLARLGFTPEARPFTAHLTIARVRDRASFEERQEFGRAIINASLEANYIMEVKEISLMQSELARAGAIYHRISSVELKSA